jgi:pyruvate formate lyase activating enzyme
MVDFRGHLAAVFFISGCNFTCGFCHNAPLLGRRQDGMPFDKLDAACASFQENWVDAAVISGGEPTLRDDLCDLIDFFKERGWAVKLDTNGSQPVMLRDCLPKVDYVAMDIKTRLADYPSWVGWDNIAAIEESISLIRDKAADYEFRTTIVEGVHKPEHMDEIGESIRGARTYVLQPFVPKDNLPDKALREQKRTGPELLAACRDRVQSYVDTVAIRGEEL